MTDERSTFETTKARLEDIVVQVRRKDVSLEASLDMLEEAVRLVNQCNDLIDQTSWRAPLDGDAPIDESAGPASEDGDGSEAEEVPVAEPEPDLAGPAPDDAPDDLRE